MTDAGDTAAAEAWLARCGLTAGVPAAVVRQAILAAYLQGVDDERRRTRGLIEGLAGRVADQSNADSKPVSLWVAA